MVRDLNLSSYRIARFFTDWEATSRRIQIDKFVEINLVTFYMGPVSSETKSYQRSTQVQVGSTQSIPSKPVYQTVTATITITSRTMRSNAALECRIYNRINSSNIFSIDFLEIILGKIKQQNLLVINAPLLRSIYVC